MEALRISGADDILTDKVVIDRILSGEKALFEILLRRHNQTLYRVIRSYLKNRDEVEDAMQDTYLIAYQKLYQYKGIAAFSTWLIRIGINEALLRIRKSSKTHFAIIGGEGEKDKEIEIRDMQMTPDKQLIRREVSGFIEKVIDQLPDKYRVVFILREIEGLDNKQVGECLNLSESNVKVRVHRAKKLLQEGMSNYITQSDIYEFGSKRCDRLVEWVMRRI